jgi:hypothetical protein
LITHKLVLNAIWLHTHLYLMHILLTKWSNSPPLVRVRQYLFLLLNTACLAGRQHISIWFDPIGGWNPRWTTDEKSAVTITLLTDATSGAETGYLSKTTVFIPGTSLNQLSSSLVFSGVGVAPSYVFLCTVFLCLVDRFYLGIVLYVLLWFTTSYNTFGFFKHSLTGFDEYVKTFLIIRIFYI